MPEIKSSDLFIENVRTIIETRKDLIAESEYALLLKAPSGGFGEKVILAAHGKTVAESKERCLDILAYFQQRGMPVVSRHELLDTNGAVIIDKMGQQQFQIFQDYEPSS